MGNNHSRPRPRSVTPTSTKPMDSKQSRPRLRSALPKNTNKPMDTKQPRPQIPQIQFRLLIMGRANAGKTTILQRVCDTTESPNIYRQNLSGEREEVRHDGPTVLPVPSYATQVQLNLTVDVSDMRCCLLSLLNSDSAWRARYRR